jgi:hypothetical protein
MTPAKSDYNRNTNRVTLGDLCLAISNGALPATVENSEWYVVRGRDLRRLTARQQSHKTSSGPGM